MCHTVFNQVGLDVLVACLNMSPTSSPTGMPAPCQRSNRVKCFQISETVGRRPKNLVTEDDCGLLREMGVSLESSKLVKEKHKLGAWRFLCSFSLQCLHLQNGEQ